MARSSKSASKAGKAGKSRRGNRRTYNPLGPVSAPKVTEVATVAIPYLAYASYKGFYLGSREAVARVVGVFANDQLRDMDASLSEALNELAYVCTSYGVSTSTLNGRPDPKWERALYLFNTARQAATQMMVGEFAGEYASDLLAAVDGKLIKAALQMRGYDLTGAAISSFMETIESVGSILAEANEGDFEGAVAQFGASSSGN